MSAIRKAIEALEASRDDVVGTINSYVPHPANERRIAPIREQLAKHDAALSALKALEAQPPKMTEQQLNNVCLTVRHDYGLLSDERRAVLRHEARVWEDAFRAAGVIPVGVNASGNDQPKEPT